MKYILGLLTLASCAQPMEQKTDNIKIVGKGPGFTVYQLTVDSHNYLIGKSNSQMTIK
jgi:hypothetical protein